MPPCRSQRLTPLFADYVSYLECSWVICLFSARELPEMKADSLHHLGDFALPVCQNAMQAMNVARSFSSACQPLPRRARALPAYSSAGLIATLQCSQTPWLTLTESRLLRYDPNAPDSQFFHHCPY
jgi:hypothetical protein